MEKKKAYFFGSLSLFLIFALILNLLPQRRAFETSLVFSNLSMKGFSSEIEFLPVIKDFTFKRVILKEFSRKNLSIEIGKGIDYSIEPLYLYDKKNIVLWKRNGIEVENFVYGISLHVEGKNGSELEDGFKSLKRELKRVVFSIKAEEYFAKLYGFFALKKRELEDKIDELKEKLSYFGEYKKRLSSKSGLIKGLYSVKISEVETEILRVSAEIYSSERRLKEYECLKTILEKFLSENLQKIGSSKELEDFFKEKNLFGCSKKAFDDAYKTLSQAIKELNDFEKGLEFTDDKAKTSTNKIALLFVSFVLAFIFFIFLAFFLEWWEREKNEIKRIIKGK